MITLHTGGIVLTYTGYTHIRLYGVLETKARYRMMLKLEFMKQRDVKLSLKWRESLGSKWWNETQFGYYVYPQWRNNLSRCHFCGQKKLSQVHNKNLWSYAMPNNYVQCHNLNVIRLHPVLFLLVEAVNDMPMTDLSDQHRSTFLVALTLSGQNFDTLVASAIHLIPATNLTRLTLSSL